MAKKKRKTTIKGYLVAQDIEKMELDADTSEYWDRVKNNLFILGDDENIVFLNREFKKIAEKYKGRYIKVTIEETPYIRGNTEGLPDMDEEYDGFEKYKRTLFSVFKIT